MTVRRTFWQAFLGIISVFVRLTGRISPKAAKLITLAANDLLFVIQRSVSDDAAIVDIKMGDTAFRLDTTTTVNDTQGRRQIRWALRTGRSQLGYEPMLRTCLNRLLKSDEEPVFMDVGAFIGLYACYVASLLGDQTRVYAVESNPTYCEAIKRSIELNAFHNVALYNAVLSDRSEQVKVDGPMVNYHGGSGQRCATVTLDKLCAREQIQPTIMKMDIHGAEGKVLPGMKEIMDSSLQHLLLELHGELYFSTHSPGTQRPDLLRLMQQHGFKAFHIAGHRNPPNVPPAVLAEMPLAYRQVEIDTCADLFFDRQEDMLLLCSKSEEAALQCIRGQKG